MANIGEICHYDREGSIVSAIRVNFYQVYLVTQIEARMFVEARELHGRESRYGWKFLLF